MPWERLFHELDDARAAPDAKAASDRVGDMTAAQLQAMITGALSLANASAKTGATVAASEDISRAARSVVDVMRRVKQTETTRTKPSLEKKHILWVDDRPDNNTFERDAFESVGFTFTLAHSTAEALQVLGKDRFAAIISDMGRAEGPREGYVLLDKLRSTGDETPFFIYAGSNAPEHKREAADRGAQGSTNNAQELFELVTRTVT